MKIQKSLNIILVSILCMYVIFRFRLLQFTMSSAKIEPSEQTPATDIQSPTISAQAFRVNESGYWRWAVVTATIIIAGKSLLLAPAVSD